MGDVCTQLCKVGAVSSEGEVERVEIVSVCRFNFKVAFKVAGTRRDKPLELDWRKGRWKCFIFLSIHIKLLKLHYLYSNAFLFTFMHNLSLRVIFQGSCKVSMQYIHILLFLGEERSASKGLDSRRIFMGERFPLLDRWHQAKWRAGQWGGTLKLSEPQEENWTGNAMRTDEEMWVVVYLISYLSHLDTGGVGMEKQLENVVRLTCWTGISSACWLACP